MKVFRLLLQAALIALTGSAAVAEDSDLLHWKPGKKVIAKLDFAFRNSPRWHGTPPEFDDYFRYYAGVTIKGRRMIRAEFTDFPNSTRIVKNEIEFYQDGPAVQVVSLDKFPSVFDGGCGVVNMLYDVDADRMVWLHCNGLA